MTTSYDVAGMFLRALGAPDTTSMRRAVAIWLRFESGNTIVGNNPWNLHSGNACPAAQGYCPGEGNLPGQIGNRYAGPGDRNVAVFDTIDSGTKAAANNLINLAPSYGYGTVIAKARAGDARGFLVAIQNSSWSAGHYSHSKLVAAFVSSLNYNNVLTFRSAAAGSGETLGAWGDHVSFPVGHILTTTDVDNIISTLDQLGYFQGDSPLGGSRSKVKSILLGHVGDAWNKALEDQLSAEFGVAAGQATDPITQVATAIGHVGDLFAGVGNVLAFLLDPENWAYGFAVVGGIALTAYGFSLLMSTYGPPTFSVPQTVPLGAGTPTRVIQGKK